MRPIASRLGRPEAGMRTVMSGDAPVSYGQIYVRDDGWESELEDCFAGQRNGLCGAASPGGLFLITARHTGIVGFTVEVHDSQPPLADEWGDVVEAPFRCRDEASLECWDGAPSWNLALTSEADYRVRYCGVGMDAARVNEYDDDSVDRATDRYLLQFRPAAPAPDVVVRSTSEHAAYWHGLR